MSASLQTPTQEDLVRLTYSSKEDAGRYAVAQRHISPGELVLAAAPYGLVMNPKFCPSALYLSSRCASSSGAVTESDATDGAQATKGSKTANKKNTLKYRASTAATTNAETSAGAHYKSALYSEDNEDSGAATASPSSSMRWYTTQSTWCAVCFHEISTGRWFCNRGSLAELAVDISEEQEELEKKIRLAEAQTATKDKEERDGEAALGFDNGGEEEDAASAAAAFRKLKKPTKSARTRKDGAVELKQKLMEKALAHREEIFYERRLQRRSRAEHGRPTVRLEGWEACTPENEKKEETSASVFAGAMSGCSGCGVLCYCSEACWRVYHTQHVSSGECTVLRGLYPRLMAEYYSTNTGGSGAAEVAVVLPGDEALHWARSSSESKMLEFQSLLFSAVVLARVCRAGYQSHLKADDSTSVGAGDSNDDGTAETKKSAVMSAGLSSAVKHSGGDNNNVEDNALTGGAAPNISFPFVPSNAVHSVVVPREVSTIQEMRRKAGLTSTVEVLDSAAQPYETVKYDNNGWKTIQTECVVFTDTLLPVSRIKGSTSNSLDDNFTTSTSRLCVRLPCYADMAQMETNLTVISKPRCSTYQRYYRAFTKRVLPTLQLLNLNDSCEKKGQEATTTSKTDLASRVCVSESYFLRLCAATQCNSFGVYDTDDHCIAFGVYPAASYFNHSCVPNICRVMHHGGRVAAFYALRAIAAGEPLMISYTDVEEQNSAERRRNLLETYRFFCRCERCSGLAEEPTMAVGRAVAYPNYPQKNRNDTFSGPIKAHDVPVVAVPESLFEKPLLLCAQCAVRGYLRPIHAAQSAEGATWSMAEVAVRECTVCHSCVVRESCGGGVDERADH